MRESLSPVSRVRLLFSQHVLTASKFGAVGLVTALLYFLAMWLAYGVLKLGYVLAVSVAYGLSTAFHYGANRYFTFVAQGGSVGRQLARYAVVWVLNYVVTLLVVRQCVEYWRLSPYVGVCCSVLITVCIGYFLSRYWVFKLQDKLP